jgi:hypothetical protein
MGTRHTYRIIETYKSNNPSLGQVETPICLIYGQYDGYPDGAPANVASFLAKGTMVNGYGLRDDDSIVFNGTGCMTAQLIGYLKEGTGNIYINSLDSRGQSGEDYLYDIISDFDTKSIVMVGYENGWEGKPAKEFFRGTPQEFLQKYGEKVEASVN